MGSEMCIRDSITSPQKCLRVGWDYQLTCPLEFDKNWTVGFWYNGPAAAENFLKITDVADPSKKFWLDVWDSQNLWTAHTHSGGQLKRFGDSFKGEIKMDGGYKAGYWSHITLVKNDGLLHFYINGVYHTYLDGNYIVANPSKTGNQGSSILRLGGAREFMYIRDLYVIPSAVEHAYVWGMTDLNGFQGVQSIKDGTYLY